MSERTPDLCSMTADLTPETSRGEWFQTYTGKRFYPTSPRAEDVCFEDISEGLSKLCRFNGHVHSFYSVAQHSVIIARELARGGHSIEVCRWGLMHDAAEAYIGDMIRPLKMQMPEFKRVEELVERAIAERFDLPWPMPEVVKEYDTRALMTERRDLLPVRREWSTKAEPFEQRIQPLMPTAAFIAFTGHAKYLGIKGA